ncbi:hypothetical protein N8376_05185 [Flavobacteriaceae bacterium]|nr:hypothetical protein [Flavobacteriaceae bacterium]
MENTNTYIKSFAKWMNKDYVFNYVATFRPKKSRIEDNNAYKTFKAILTNPNEIKSLFYVIEADRYRNSAHAHILIEANSCYLEDLRTNKINPKTEIPYFEKVESQERLVRYVQKNMGREQHRNIFVRNHGLIVRSQVEEENIMDTIHQMPQPYFKGVEKYDINKQLISAFEHPNKKHHDKAERFMNLFSFNRLIKYPSIR